MARGLTFNYCDATDPADIAENYDVIEAGIRDLFNAEIAPFVIAEYGADDTCALDQAFNDWTDMLCKEGEIDESVYNTVTRNDD